MRDGILLNSVTIAIVVLGFNLLGDSLRDLLDPYLRGKGPFGSYGA